MMMWSDLLPLLYHVFHVERMCPKAFVTCRIVINAP